MSDYWIGLRASGDDKGVYVACRYCGREMGVAAIPAHVAKKHPRRRTCA